MIKVSGYELNLHTIMNSGQCFRIFEIKEHEYDLLSGNYAVHVIFEPSSNCYLFDCPDHKWNYWENYLDLQTDYQQFYKVIMQSDDDYRLCEYDVDVYENGQYKMELVLTV